MDTPPPAERIDTLARRVRWLDRWRRAMSVVLSVLAWVMLTRSVGVFLGQWSMLAMMIAFLFATAAWWLAEAAFAYLTALWETEHDTLRRTRGLPRAELIVRKKHA